MLCHKVTEQALWVKGPELAKEGAEEWDEVKWEALFLLGPAVSAYVQVADIKKHT